MQLISNYTRFPLGTKVVATQIKRGSDSGGCGLSPFLSRPCVAHPFQLLNARFSLEPAFPAALTRVRGGATAPHRINPVLTFGIKLTFTPVTANVPVDDAPAGDASTLPSPSRFASTTICSTAHPFVNSPTGNPAMDENVLPVTLNEHTFPYARNPA